jgi:hypothetical protein
MHVLKIHVCNAMAISCKEATFKIQNPAEIGLPILYRRRRNGLPKPNFSANEPHKIFSKEVKRRAREKFIER